MKSTTKKNKNAFTLVELMLAVGFLGTMLVAIAALTIRIVNIYQKGLAMRAVNANGRTIMSDLSKYVGGSKLGTGVGKDINPVVDPSNWAFGSGSIINARKKYFFVNRNSATGVENYGAFCSGSYVYVWNTAATLNAYEDASTEEKAAMDMIRVNVAGKQMIPRFARIQFSAIKEYNEDFATTTNESENPVKEFAPCHTTDSTDSKPATLSLTVAQAKDYHELISDDGSDLAVYDFMVHNGVRSTRTGHALYSISFILATRKGGVNIMQSSDFCHGAEGLGAGEFDQLGLDYCAVNKFDLVVQQSSDTSTIKEE